MTGYGQQYSRMVLCEEDNKAWQMPKTSGLNPSAPSYTIKII